MLVTLALILVIAGVLTPLILRDLERAQERARARRRERLSLHFRFTVTTDVSGFVAAMNAATRQVAALEREMRKAGAAIQAGIKKTVI